MSPEFKNFYKNEAPCKEVVQKVWKPKTQPNAIHVRNAFDHLYSITAPIPMAINLMVVPPLERDDTETKTYAPKAGFHSPHTPAVAIHACTLDLQASELRK